MRLFDGLQHTDYQDVLRALGYYVDQQGWRNLRLVEQEDGLLLQCTAGVDSRDFTFYLFTDEDLQALLRQAYTHRARAAAAPTMPSPDTLLESEPVTAPLSPRALPDAKPVAVPTSASQAPADLAAEERGGEGEDSLLNGMPASSGSPGTFRRPPLEDSVRD